MPWRIFCIEQIEHVWPQKTPVCVDRPGPGRLWDRRVGEILHVSRRAPGRPPDFDRAVSARPSAPRHGFEFGIRHTSAASGLTRDTLCYSWLRE